MISVGIIVLLVNAVLLCGGQVNKPAQVMHNGPKVLIKSSALNHRQRSDLYEVYLTPYHYIEKEARAVAVIAGNGIHGTVVFIQSKPPAGIVSIRGNITGLSPGKHGFNIHESGDLRRGCDLTGAHYNPHGFSHGSREARHRHVGDLGNIEADQRGLAVVDIVDKQITLTGTRSIIGRSLVIHQDEDDLGVTLNDLSRNNGNAGPGIACGVIGTLN